MVHIDSSSTSASLLLKRFLSRPSRAWAGTLCDGEGEVVGPGVFTVGGGETGCVFSFVGKCPGWIWGRGWKHVDWATRPVRSSLAEFHSYPQEVLSYAISLY